MDACDPLPFTELLVPLPSGSPFLRYAGMSPVWFAAVRGKPEMVRPLVRAGGDVNQVGGVCLRAIFVPLLTRTLHNPHPRGGAPHPPHASPTQLFRVLARPVLHVCRCLPRACRP